MNSSNGLEMRKMGIAGTESTENLHSHAVFTKVHNMPKLLSLATGSQCRQ